MAYDDAFFERYAEYMLEPTVRRNHNRVFDLLDRLNDDIISWRSNVVDLGCGLGEFQQYGHRYSGYCGVDLYPRLKSASFVLKADYLGLTFLKELPFSPDVFVSMFSVEPICSPGMRNGYYVNLFRNCPTLRLGLSAGFYYSSKKDETRVGETGGIMSYQTNDEIEPNDVYDEMRITMRTPSKMFGPDVVEVFKIMRRKL